MLKKIAVLIAAICATSAMAATDINKATQAELDTIKGLGPATAKLILEERKAGHFKSWNDLIGRVKGIGVARASQLSADGLTVGGESFKPAVKPVEDSAKAKKP